MIGAGPRSVVEPVEMASAKWAANRSGSMVAEVMITLRSGRFGSSRFR
jgi:hypothetical protein